MSVERLRDLVHPEMVPEVKKMASNLSKFADIRLWRGGSATGNQHTRNSAKRRAWQLFRNYVNIIPKI